MGLKKKQTVILAVLFLSFVGGLYYLYVLMTRAGDQWPFFSEPGSLTREIAQLNTDIGRLRQEVLKIPEAREKLEKVKIDYELAIRVLPRENSPDQLLAAIRMKATQAGVIPDSLTPAVSGGQQRTGRRGAGAANMFEEWSFTLRIRGSYDQIASFVNRMEEFESTDVSRTGSEKRFFKVSAIDINTEMNGMSFLFPPENTEDKKGHNCTLIMQTYRYTGE